MKRSIKILLTLLIITAMTISPISSVIAYAHSEQNTEEITEGKMLSEIAYINEFLKIYGLTFNDILKMQKRDQEFFTSLKNYNKVKSSDIRGKSNSILNNTSETINEPDRTESDSLGRRYDYAKKMAEKNKKTDSNATELEKEIIYMYMSHFIDIPTGILSEVDPSISEEGYFSLYITNDDRAAYELYFQKQGDKRNIRDMCTGIKSIQDISNKEVYEEILSVKDKVRDVFLESRSVFEGIKKIAQNSEEGKEIYDMGKTYIEIGDTIKKVINDEYKSNDPKVVMEALEEDLKFTCLHNDHHGLHVGKNT